MSDWVEYCNLRNEGQWAKRRIANGYTEPYKVKYWSIGNENYGDWEIGAKPAEEWGRLVTESAKMMKRVDPEMELSAAALVDLDWNLNLLKSCGERLDWISIHSYWDGINDTNAYADYGQCMAYTNHLEDFVSKIRGLLAAMGLEKKIRIAFDEWNLRGWYHPNIHRGRQTNNPDDYLTPRNLNDENCRYTMADAVFNACFLNMANRNCDIVGMTNYAPIVNTRGCIYTHKDGIVLRSTYHVFDLYVNELGDTVLDAFAEGGPVLNVHDKRGNAAETAAIDAVATLDAKGNVVIAAVNKDPNAAHSLRVELVGAQTPERVSVHTLAGKTSESYNDIGHEEAVPSEPVVSAYDAAEGITLSPHSVNIIRFDGI
jgi:alpha-N-arabinofuranosidase